MSEVSRLDRLRGEAATQEAEVDLLAESFDESTGLSWLWAFLFGPLYFLAHGFWQRALLVLLLNFFIIGFFVAPFLAYPAWKARAKEKAEKMLLVDRVRSGR
ncbi:DUF2628 domain-containing protein [Nioella nitratireducens]|uniref:DUF2628 domain-containing protein n=1 Tax=Nioella nitratireducens TaxID=1287720 RepID=UPI0013149A96|nr:DUF2628 domain-containing protein [Nioella nitratireducens]